MMNEIEALRYLYAEHKLIARTHQMAHRRYARGEEVSPIEHLAMQIIEADEKRDTARLVTLAHEWAKVMNE